MGLVQHGSQLTTGYNHHQKLPLVPTLILVSRGEDEDVEDDGAWFGNMKVSLSRALPIVRKLMLVTLQNISGLLSTHTGSSDIISNVRPWPQY